ncbi:ficolin-1-A-like isoform X2 [Hyperolius riggenbachi]|uniref:ficolin-1-A-like isoform X2 n=1 Tax=Hyperolius riggenbachi TaxID=752182 RepID=UPI0035A34331
MRGAGQIARWILWVTVIVYLNVDACQDVNEITAKWKNNIDLLRGCQGQDRFRGIIGAIGPTGVLGIPGQQGVRGQKGENGEPGIPGLPGAQGPPGSKGENGPAGPPGNKGPRNCRDLMDSGRSLTGWYYIYPEGQPLRVMCDMETDGGGWIVFHKRQDGSVNFNRNWESYKTGFGNQWSEFWLGNENIHSLTTTGDFELRIDLTDINSTYASYSRFSLGGEPEKYTLHLGNYIGGTAGDLLSFHNNNNFSTNDQDNDGSNEENCAELYAAPWWYQACTESSLNGPYLQEEQEEKAGFVWSEMKFRPVEQEK